MNLTIIADKLLTGGIIVYSMGLMRLSGIFDDYDKRVKYFLNTGATLFIMGASIELVKG
jgi:hypothetical protein